MSDHPSIYVHRIEKVEDKQYEDNFYCVVHFDLNLGVNKKLISGRNHRDFDNKYIICQSVVHNVVCKVNFVPFIQNGDSNPLNIKYNTTYSIEGNEKASATYRKVSYNYQDKTKTKVIDSNPIEFNLKPIIMNEDNLDLSGIIDPKEWIREKLNTLITESTIEVIEESEKLSIPVIEYIAVSINNAIPANWDVLISSETYKNYKGEDGKWKFGIDPQKNVIDVDVNKDNLKLVKESLGNANIDGKTYEVMDTYSHDFPNAVAELDGIDSENKYNIIKVKQHKNNSETETEDVLAIVEKEQLDEKYFKVDDDFAKDGYFHKYFDGIFAEPVDPINEDKGYLYYLKYKDYTDLDTSKT